MVWFQLPFHISILQDDGIERLKTHLDRYAKDHPREWHSFVYCRVDGFEVDKEKVKITMGFQHRSAWQDLGGILMSKSHLIAYVYQKGKHLGYIYEELPKRDLVYYAGSLKDGGVKDYGYRMDLHHRDNLQVDDISGPKSASRDSADDMFLAHLHRSHI